MMLLLFIVLSSSVNLHYCETITKDNPDPSQYVSGEWSDKIIDRINELKNQTFSCGDVVRPYQLGFAVIDDIRSVSRWHEVTTNDAIECAKIIFNNWGIGFPECNNGVLLFLSINDRKWSIITGKGSKKVLGERVRNYIGDDMKFYLRNKNYGESVYVGITNIVDVLLNQQSSTIMQEIKSSDNSAATFLIVSFTTLCSIALCIVGCLCCIPLYDRCKYRKTRKKIDKLIGYGKKTKKKVDVEMEDCPICLELLRDKPIIETLCDHYFHRICIDEWRRNNNTCPICRQDISSGNNPINNNVMQRINHEESANVTRNYVSSLSYGEQRYIDSVYYTQLDNTWLNLSFNDIFRNSTGYNHTTYQNSGYSGGDYGGGYSGYSGGDYGGGSCDGGGFSGGGW